MVHQAGGFVYCIQTFGHFEMFIIGLVEGAGFPSINERVGK